MTIAMIMTLKIMEIADEEDDNRKGSDFVKCSLVADVDYDDDDDDDDDDLDDHDDHDDHQMITVEEVISSNAVR